jgi:hypothetical protein
LCFPATSVTVLRSTSLRIATHSLFTEAGLFMEWIKEPGQVKGLAL